MFHLQPQRNYYNLIGFSQDTIFEVDVKIHFPYTCTYDFGDIPLMMRNSQIFITGIHQLLAQIFAICIKLLTSGINFLLLNDNLLHNTLFTYFGGDHIIVIWLIFILSLHLLLKAIFSTQIERIIIKFQSCRMQFISYQHDAKNA